MLGGRGGRVGLAVRVGGEPISHAAYGVNQWNLVAAIDLLAQAAHSGVDHVGLWIELIAPHGSEQHGPGRHLLRMRHHVGEQAAFRSEGAGASALPSGSEENRYPTPRTV